MTKRGERGLLVVFLQIVPPASEREASMDDRTRRCENDTGDEPPKPEPLFLVDRFLPRAPLPALPRLLLPLSL
jgi:hypothetical protein